MSDHEAPRIQGVNTPVAGFQIQPIAYADPKQYPMGLEVLVAAPGLLQPLGSVVIPAGSMIALLPPEVARVLMAEFRKVIAAQARIAGNGTDGVAPPGIGG